jgi:hypothetical protein
MKRFLLSACCVLLCAHPAAAQDEAPATHAPAFERWVEFQALTAVTRYRFVETSDDVVTSNQAQHKEVLRGRFNVDAQRRFTLNVGALSGASFISSWNNTGVGTGGPATALYFRQLFVDANPIRCLDLQYGSLYLLRGENTEMTTYDEDGYVTGERVSVRNASYFFFDEISATRGLIGPFNTPSLSDRWRGLHDANYYQFLVTKRLTPKLRASADYTSDTGAHVVHAAVFTALTPGRNPVSLRYEQYARFEINPANGFAVAAERGVARVRLQGGYTTIDEKYGGWNADRIQRGKRVFATLTAPVTRDLSLSVFATEAFHSPYAISNRTRVDVVLTFDLLGALKHAHAL